MHYQKYAAIEKISCVSDLQSIAISSYCPFDIVLTNSNQTWQRFSSIIINLSFKQGHLRYEYCSLFPCENIPERMVKSACFKQWLEKAK